VTARDPGSAHEGAAFVSEAIERKWPFAFTLVGCGAAIEILEGTGLAVTPWPAVSPRANALARRTADRILADCQPHAVLTGLAYPGFGPDEAIFSAVSTTRLLTACIQDFWGYVGGFRRGRVPDLFFVHDKLAARLTRERTGRGTRIVVTGSPRRARMAASGRRSRPHPVKSARPRPLVVYFGQPAGIPGCLDNFRHFVEALRRTSVPVDVRYRRHPNDSMTADGYSVMLARQPNPFHFSPADRPVERDLLDADLAVTCFSSIGLDHHYLQLANARLLAPVLFITIGASIRQLLRRQVGLPEVPNVVLGWAAGVNSKQALAPALDRLLADPRVPAARFRRRIVRSLGQQKDPAHLIARCLLNHTSGFQ
jgi:hypothetical protein